MEWNDEVIGRLRSLWDEGHSTAEIGRRLGVSKNAIVGKAHRLSLPHRPSPIRRGAAETPRTVSTRRPVGSTLPPLPAYETATRPAAEASVPPTPPVIAPRPAVTTLAPEPAPSPAPPPMTAVRATPQRSARLICCCWPIGEPGTPSFHFCDVDALAGKPYCSEHAQLAYVKVRDRRDEAA